MPKASNTSSNGASPHVLLAPERLMNRVYGASYPHEGNEAERDCGAHTPTLIDSERI
jgi:hypothetical protein